MVFRFYARQLSEATRGLAAIVFVAGMLLMGFAVLIFALPKLFGYLAAGVFFLISLSVLGYAFRLFVAASAMDRSARQREPEPQGNEPAVYRKQVDVQVHEREQGGE